MGEIQASPPFEPRSIHIIKRTNTTERNALEIGEPGLITNKLKSYPISINIYIPQDKRIFKQF